MTTALSPESRILIQDDLEDLDPHRAVVAEVRVEDVDQLGHLLPAFDLPRALCLARPTSPVSPAYSRKPAREYCCMMVARTNETSASAALDTRAKERKRHRRRATKGTPRAAVARSVPRSTVARHMAYGMPLRQCLARRTSAAQQAWPTSKKPGAGCSRLTSVMIEKAASSLRVLGLHHTSSSSSRRACVLQIARFVPGWPQVQTKAIGSLAWTTSPRATACEGPAAARSIRGRAAARPRRFRAAACCARRRWPRSRPCSGSRPRARPLLIEYLHLIQDHEGCLPEGHLQALAEELRIPMAEVYEVATFYAHFDVVGAGEERPAKVTVRVCDSLSCALAGAEALLSSLQGEKLRVRASCVRRASARVTRRPQSRSGTGMSIMRRRPRSGTWRCAARCIRRCRPIRTSTPT